MKILVQEKAKWTFFFRERGYDKTIKQIRIINQGGDGERGGRRPTNDYHMKGYKWQGLCRDYLSLNKAFIFDGDEEREDGRRGDLEWC